VRLLVVVEHYEEVILRTIQRDDATYEWFKNDWVKLAAVHPETRAVSVFNNGEFQVYSPSYLPMAVDNVDSYILNYSDNIPVLKIA